MYYQKGDAGVVAYFFYRRSKKDTFQKVKVFGHHNQHVQIPTFCKALYGLINFFTRYMVKRGFYILKILK